MTPQNLAVCFAPTLFSLTNSLKPKATSSLSRKGSFKRNNVHTTLTPELVASNKEITESVVSECVCVCVQMLDAQLYFSTKLI